MYPKDYEKAALKWMRDAAKELSGHLYEENASPIFCAGIISGRIDELTGMLKAIVEDDQGNVFLLAEAKKVLLKGKN